MEKVGNRIPRFIVIFLLGLLLGTFLALALGYGMKVSLLRLNAKWMLYFGGFGIFLVGYGLYKQYFVLYYEKPFYIEMIESLLLLLGALCILIGFPAIIIYWLTNPQSYKKAIQIGVLLISIGLSIMIYFRYQEKITTITEKISFFSSVCLGPPTIIEFIL